MKSIVLFRPCPMVFNGRIESNIQQVKCSNGDV